MEWNNIHSAFVRGEVPDQDVTNAWLRSIGLPEVQDSNEEEEESDDLDLNATGRLAAAGVEVQPGSIAEDFIQQAEDVGYEMDDLDLLMMAMFSQVENNNNNDEDSEYTLVQCKKSFHDIMKDEEIWVADSAATTHMTFSNTGMRNCRKAEAKDSLVMGNGSDAQAQCIGDVYGSLIGMESNPIDVSLKEVTYSPTAKFNLISLPALMKKGWKMIGDLNKIIITKGNMQVKFDIIVPTPKGMLFCLRMKRSTSTEVGAINVNSRRYLYTANEIHELFGHINETDCRRMAAQLGIEVKRGAMKPCQECMLAKARKKNLKRVCFKDEKKDNVRRMFLDLSKIKCPPELLKVVKSVYKPNWRLLEDEQTEMKFTEFFNTKNGMVEPTCELINAWKNQGKPVQVIRCDNAGENQKLQKRLKSADWKLSNIKFEYTGRHTPQQNYLVEKGFETLYSRSRAMMNAAKVPEELKYKLFRDAIHTATKLDSLVTVKSKGKSCTRHHMWYGKEPAFVKNMKVWGEAGIVSNKSTNTNKLQNKGIMCMFVGYPDDHAGDCYRMYDPKTSRILTTRDVRWIGKYYYGHDKIKKEVKVEADSGLEEAVPDDTDDKDAIQQTNQVAAMNDDSDDDSSVESQPQANMANATRAATRSADGSVTTRSGRTVRPPRLLMNEMANVFTEAELKYYNAMQEINEFEGTEVAAVAGSQVLRNIACVGAGIGGGFENTAELHVMKFDEAMSKPDKDYWIEAVNKEWNRFKQYGVFKSVRKEDVPENAKFVSTTWAMKKKASGKYRARMNMRGFEQQDGVHYDSSSINSPVTNDVTIRTVIVLMLMAGWTARLVDVRGAFLHGSFDNGEEIYTEVPQGFERFVDKDKYVLLLMKTVYGLKQSAKMFWVELLKAMQFMKFLRSDADPCLYYKHTDNGLVIWLSWVDDCLCIGPSIEVMKAKKDMMNLFDCEDVGEFNEYVGCKIDKDSDQKKIKFTQPVLIQSFYDEFSLADRQYKTPAEAGKVLSKCEEGQELSRSDQTKFRSGVGKLLHLMRWSRPEIWNSVREVSRRMQMANEDHMKAMKRIMKYCYSTKKRGWKLNPRTDWNGTSMSYEFTIAGRSDSNYATCKDTRKSITGYYVTLEGAVVAVKSGMQRIIALSVCEAEVIAMVQCVQEMMYLKKLLTSMKLKVSQPMILEVDNKGAVDLANGWSIGGGTKHMDVRIMFLRELKEQGTLLVKWIATQDNAADIFTKNVDPSTFERHVEVFCDE